MTRETIHCRREPFMCNQVGILFRQRIGEAGLIAVGLPVQMKVLTPSEMDSFAAEPTLSLKPETAQQLMDELWNCGLRPTEGTGSAGAMAATQAHLQDMRTLVFKKEAK
jgi:hypothetical protein